MNSLKNHCSVVFSLIVLLFSIEFSMIADKLVTNYEYKMGRDYNIIVVSQKPLNERLLKLKISSFRSIEKVETKNVIDRLENEISSKNLDIIKNSLPEFYSVKLTSFPSSKHMKKVSEILMNFDGVKRVETFSKTHDKIYKILILFKHISLCFTILIAIMGIFLIFKQMKIWLYEHRRRIEVMTDLGAPYWIKSAILYKITIGDSFIATCFVEFVFLCIFNSESVSDYFTQMGLKLPDFDFLSNTLLLFGSSILVSIICVSFVMFKSSDKQ